MELGIAGKRAIVCASSKGLGCGCALALAREGAEVIINARTTADVEKTAKEIAAATGAKVIPVAADVTTSEGREALLAVCPDPDILVNNAGGPPAGDFHDWDEKDWQKAVNDNMIAPIMLMKAVIDGMISRRFGRIVNITSRSVRTPLFHLGLSNGARAGLTGFVAGLSRQVAKHNVIINNLLPGPFATDRQVGGIRRDAQKEGISFEEMLAKRSAAVPVGRLGTAEEFGDVCAFLCSARAEFLVGQNILLDGGVVPLTV